MTLVYRIEKPRKKPKKKRNQDLKYQAYIRSKRCLVCGHPETIHHHESLSGGSMASKCADNESLPLCVICHGERHTQGRYTFYKMYNINYREEILRLQEGYDETIRQYR